MIQLHPERKVRGKRLGRHVEHDAVSHAFAAPMSVGPVRSVTWDRQCPAFDQGDVGSCTGNAMAGLLMTRPFYRTGRELTEADALAIYTLATRLDNVPGEYPTEDTGSSGIAVMKAAKKLGYIKGYHHCFSLQSVLHALQSGPGITGINWYEGMDEPSGWAGVVEPTGAQRGSHEVEVYGVDVEAGLVLMWNSWGSWGNGGRFCMSFASYQRLLREHGDFTVALP